VHECAHGTGAVVGVPQLQNLMPHKRKSGFEHHASMSGSHSASGVAEIFGNYLGWDVSPHDLKNR
jgi:hypothetical protein